MQNEAGFKSASPFQDDVLALPVKDLDVASEWYSHHFGMSEAERKGNPNPAIVMERQGVKIGFSTNGGDPSQNGAAIRVTNIRAVRDELEARGVKTANWRIDERDGEKLQVFFVVAPDGLCFYFHEPIDDAARNA